MIVTVQYSQNLFNKLSLIQRGTPASLVAQSSQGTLGKKDVVIVTVLPVKLLLKVTSKKMDPKFISLYFKVPKTTQECFRRFHRLFDLSNSSMGELFRAAEGRDLDKVLEEIRSYKDEKVRSVFGMVVIKRVEIHGNQERV